MKTYLDCVPCFVNQALRSARLVSDDPVVHQRVLRSVLAATAEIDLDQCPPAMGRQIHLFIREALGDDDPYREIKRRFNAKAARMLPELRQRVRASSDPFDAAVRVAIAGNIIDFGVPGAVIDDERLASTVERCFEAALDDEALALLREAVNRASSVLLLADNAGEVFFDRLLLEQLGAAAPAATLTVAVRGGPVINDATAADAQQAGLDQLATLIDNGYDAPGTILEHCSPSFRRAFDEADLVIAKGQGNFETLAESTPREVFFLFQAKCTVVARHVGVANGTPVVARRSPSSLRSEPSGCHQPPPR